MISKQSYYACETLLEYLRRCAADILEMAVILDVFQVALYPISVYTVGQDPSLLKNSCLLPKLHNSRHVMHHFLGLHELNLSLLYLPTLPGFSVRVRESYGNKAAHSLVNLTSRCAPPGNGLRTYRQNRDLRFPFIELCNG